MRKHGSAPAALAVRVLTAWSYAVRAAVAAVVPGQPGPRSTGPTPGQALFPGRGESSAASRARRADVS